MQKIVNDLKYDFMEVQPHEDAIDESTKRIWQVVYVYRKGRLIAEGRAACCLADIKDKLFDVEQGYEIATGRARIAVEKKRSYGHLPEGYYKGAYYGPIYSRPKQRVPPESSTRYFGRKLTNYCPECGKWLSNQRPDPAYWPSQEVERKCARQQ